MENKFINRYSSYCNCLDGLKEAKNRDLSDDFILSGTIQKFNLTFDISWKVMKDIIVKYHMIQYASGSPRDTLSQAFEVGLIDDDVWLEMLKTRNELAHDYNGETARESLDRIINVYIAKFDEFSSEAKKYLEKIH